MTKLESSSIPTKACVRRYTTQAHRSVFFLHRLSMLKYGEKGPTITAVRQKETLNPKPRVCTKKHINQEKMAANICGNIPPIMENQMEKNMDN